MPSNDLPIDRARPDAPPRPGVAAASMNTVTHSSAPSADPSANHTAASLKNGDSIEDMETVTRCAFLTQCVSKSMEDNVFTPSMFLVRGAA